MKLSDLPPYFDGKVKLMKPLTGEVKTMCWVWQRSLSHGYAQGYWEGKVVRMHTVTLRLAGRPRPSGLEPDHLCCRRACINPEHVEYVTKSVNASRVKARGRHWVTSRTHCSQGHEYTPENTYVRVHKDGYTQRVCRQCHNTESKLTKRFARTGSADDPQRKTQCKFGHGPENYVFDSRGKRRCRECARLRKRGLL